MKAKSDRWLRELDFRINDQISCVILDDKERSNKNTIRQYHDELKSTKKMFEIDFQHVHKVYDIADSLSLQFSTVFEEVFNESIQNRINFYRSEDQFDFLNEMLNILKELSEKCDDSVIFWLDNFTDVLKIKESRNICGMLRSHYQRQPNVTYIFTSCNTEGVNAIFNDYDEPFYYSASIIKTYDRYAK